MSFSQHLVLWLHVAFVIFTIGPATMAIMSTPRYIRKRDVRILRYLTRMTFIFGVGSLGVLIAGIALSSMIGKESKPWIIISETLFLVSVLLLGLIHRDQRHAIKALEAATATAAHVADQPAAGAGQDPPPDGTGPQRTRRRRRRRGRGPAGGRSHRVDPGAPGHRRARPDRHDRRYRHRDLARHPGPHGLERLIG